MREQPHVPSYYRHPETGEYYFYPGPVDGEAVFYRVKTPEAHADLVAYLILGGEVYAWPFYLEWIKFVE